MTFYPSGTIKSKHKPNKVFFTGMSTVGKTRPSFRSTNIELVKRDLMNHFRTPRGSRVMMPEFGTRIYELLFDPYDDLTKGAIIEDVTTVVKFDPRVTLENMDVNEDGHTLIIRLSLRISPENVVEDMLVTYSLRNNA